MSAADQLQELRALRSEREFRTALAFMDVERSAMPPRGDIEFPPRAKWLEISKRKSALNPLTAKEKAILDALNKPITIDLKDAKFEEVIAYLEEKTGLTFLVDKNALEQANVGYDTPVTVKARAVSLRSIFRKVLGELNLAYVIKDEMLQITSAERAKTMTTTRAYYLGDLVGVGGFNFGPLGNALQMYNDVTQLIATIVQTVDPDSWEINGKGGVGTITFNPGTMTLIIKNTAEVHYSLAGGSVR
jgi:type II secretory pathway component GspD/PulD (secretin)